ncbi:MAG: Uma2 family endonuclease [Cyanobacteria bacterium P01_G01_bin.49]
MLTLAKWSVEDYHAMIEVGILSDRCVELLAGEIIEMSPEGPLHTYTVTESVKYLRSVLDGFAEVREAHPITLSNSEPEPDLTIVKLPNSRYKTRHPDPEDIYWLIEIANTTLTRDLTLKHRIYAQNNIKEYWVVDLKKQQITIFREPMGEFYQQQQVYTQGAISPLEFPDLQISVHTILQG